MKVDAIICADLHFRASQPVCRIDDFLEAQINKMKWLADLQKEHDDCPILCGGDYFHKWKAEPIILSACIKHMPFVYGISGNHDSKNHNIELMDQTGLQVLHEARKINVLNDNWISINGFSVLGVPYGGNIRDIENEEADILICHEMIYQTPEHWQKKNGSQALAFLKKHKGYQLIVTGHNHKPFTAEHKGRLLVNPGSLMRMTADQKDYKPRVYLWNKESNTVKIEYVPIDSKAVETVYLEKTKERDERMESFIDRLQSSKEVGLSFEKNLENYLANNRVRTSVKDVINKCIGE